MKTHGKCFCLLSHLSVPTSEQGSLRKLAKIAFSPIYRTLASHLSMPFEHLESYGNLAHPITSQLPKIDLAVPSDDQIFQV